MFVARSQRVSLAKKKAAKSPKKKLSLYCVSFYGKKKEKRKKKESCVALFLPRIHMRTTLLFKNCCVRELVSAKGELVSESLVSAKVELRLQR